MKIIWEKDDGEFPLSCGKCPFGANLRIEDEGEGKPTMFAVDCMITGNVEDWEEGYQYKPDYCPLVLEKDVMTWLLAKQYDVVDCSHWADGFAYNSPKFQEGLRQIREIRKAMEKEWKEIQ